MSPLRTYKNLSDSNLNLGAQLIDYQSILPPISSRDKRKIDSKLLKIKEIMERWEKGGGKMVVRGHPLGSQVGRACQGEKF